MLVLFIDYMTDNIIPVINSLQRPLPIIDSF